jgi:hypothetical protein
MLSVLASPRLSHNCTTGRITGAMGKDNGMRQLGQKGSVPEGISSAQLWQQAAFFSASVRCPETGGAIGRMASGWTSRNLPGIRHTTHTVTCTLGCVERQLVQTSIALKFWELETAGRANFDADT